MKIEPIGRRVAAYRKSAGFRTAADLADAISNPSITKSTIQNVESGRKADLAVSQLLEISKALDVPPVALVVPINLPLELAAIPGVGDTIASMTNWEVVDWFTMRDNRTESSTLGDWVRVVMANIGALQEAVADFPAALEDSQIKHEVEEFVQRSDEGDEYVTYYDPNEWAQQFVQMTAEKAQNAYANLKRLTKALDLSWAEGPWLEYDADAGESDAPITSPVRP